MRVIINADDCGYDKRIDSHIKNAIEKGKISSTTIMANMDDFEGALSLYKEFHKDISFGVHLNLTEGIPLLKSRTLLEYGYYSEKEGIIVFDGKRAHSFGRKKLPKDIRTAIYEELAAQIQMIQNAGVTISHIDSHHHIHTSVSLMGVISQLSKDYNIPKMRRMRNYVPLGLSFYGRQTWALLSKMHNRDFLFAKYFGAVKEYFDNPNLIILNEKDTIELMCHPGNQGIEFREEEEMLLKLNFPENMSLINYYDL